MADLTVIILTHNEALHIERAIRSVAPVASRVVVVDSFSSDDTVQRARALGAETLTHPWSNYARQFQWGVDQACVDSGWIMRLDADEYIEPDLADEIERCLPTLDPEIGGVLLNRKHIFMGRFIRHGGRYPLQLLRIWRAGAGAIEQRWMDEHIVLTRGRSVPFEGGFCDCNLKDLTFFVAKHNSYATREAVDVLMDRIAPDWAGEKVGPLNAQARLRRMAKVLIYNRIGLLGPMLYFLYRYVLQLGVLDGPEGLIYHLLQGLWYRFLVAAKVIEFERALSAEPNVEAKVRRLGELTGHAMTLSA